MKQYAGTREAVTDVWQVWYKNRMFNYFILIQGTEEEMEDYLYSEMGYVGRYRALSQKMKSEKLETLEHQSTLLPRLTTYEPCI